MLYFIVKTKLNYFDIKYTLLNYHFTGGMNAHYGRVLILMQL